MNTPTVLSSTFVMKYQIHASFDSWFESNKEMPTLIKWAINWETPCLEVSIAQIFHGLLGCSLYLFITNTLKESAPSTNCTITPAMPNISQELVGYSDIIILVFIMNSFRSYSSYQP